MGHKKNELKKHIHYCFSCGAMLDNIKQKIIHRINQKKGICKNNIVILCPKCKYKFSLWRFKIYLVEISNIVLGFYFDNHSKRYRKIILNALQHQRNKYYGQE